MDARLAAVSQEVTELMADFRLSEGLKNHILTDMERLLLVVPGVGKTGYGATYIYSCI